MGAAGNDRILEHLKQGSGRFLERVGDHDVRLAELAKGQHPVAVVLGCADSRTAPEIVFDSQLGELFVVRVAGNIADSSSIASIEYAVAILGVKLILVLAHQSCGALGAALDRNHASPNIKGLIDHITPAIEMAGDRDVDSVAQRSARLSASRLTAESEILRDAVENDELRIVTGFHDFTTGAVEFD